MAAAITEAPQVSANDRLMFTTFLAGVLHAILILGIGWTYMEHKTASPTLEITLAQHKAKQAPDEADFLAQANQQGSGTLEEKKQLSTTEMANFEDNVIRKVDPVQQAATQPPKKPTAAKLVATTASSRNKTVQKSPQKVDPTATLANESAVSMLQRSLEIASLEAQLKEKRQARAKRPRKRQLTAASAKAVADAFYLNSWREKVERVGNQFYPQEARKKKLFGSLRMMVSVSADGEVQDIRVLRSSGHAVLDQAAVQIVRRASPFAPFPPEIAKDTDILEIIRTWRFEKGNQLTSHS
ncbi:MAG: energy transducer TonB [Gammaproteobacteria bacterium]|nr:MAG: energy transducer TonB [Gammaproteobacteria bacterium]